MAGGSEPLCSRSKSGEWWSGGSRAEPCLGTRLGSGERGKRQRGECLQKDGVELGSESRTADVGEGLIGEDGVVKAKSNFPLNPAARPNGY